MTAGVAPRRSGLGGCQGRQAAQEHHDSQKGTGDADACFGHGSPLSGRWLRPPLSQAIQDWGPVVENVLATASMRRKKFILSMPGA